MASGSDLLGPLARDKALELHLKTQAMTPLEAVVSVTLTNAELLGIADETGTVIDGRYADLLVVDGDALADLRILRDRSRLALIMRQGRVRKAAYKIV
ncbi:amidohydrolase family protein [Dactylosporangium roseum]|uniref:amidohydrolase family protein n=1 Tax=Dactylosporangium roseum TaxID=47989 RepID=UPI0021B43B7F|nr:amidohydrolase family protein [Dactylosporangium roseum]